MHNTRDIRKPRPAGAFTLMEVLIVMIILGVLAALVMPQFSNASEQTNDTSVRRHLQIIRSQIEYYRMRTMADPQLIANQWDDLLVTDMLHAEPVNPFNESSVIAAAPAAGVGWVWRDNGNGVLQIYATDNTFLAELVE